MITLSLDPDIRELTAGLNRPSRKVQTAIRRAVRKLILWLKRQMLQQASRISGVAQKEIVWHRRIYLDEHVSASRHNPNGVGSGSGYWFSQDFYFSDT